jgi:hypothetical protein
MVILGSSRSEDHSACGHRLCAGISKMRKLSAFLLVAAPLVFGSTNNCPNATTSSSVSNGASSTSVVIPGAGPGNDLGTLVTSGGCTAVDLKFSNFNNSTFSGGENGVETLAGTYLAEVPAGTSNNQFIDPDTLTFATVRGTATVSTDGNNNDGKNNWVSNHSNNPATDDITYNVSNSGTNPAAVINNFVLTVYDPSIASGASGSIVVDICEGASPNTQITSASACTAASGTAFVTATLALTTSAQQTLDIALSANPAALDITTVITLTGGGGSLTAGFDAFSESFDEAPEPATFALVGLTLAAVGFVRLHFRRRTSIG